MEYRCPIHESTEFLCDRPAQYLVSGTAICSYHAAGAGLVIRDGQVTIVTSDPACQKAVRSRVKLVNEGERQG